VDTVGFMPVGIWQALLTVNGRWSGLVGDSCGGHNIAGLERKSGSASHII